MAGLDIGVVERIELAPQHVAFEDQSLDHRLLLVRAAGLALDIVEGEIRIARRLGQALVEIGERVAGDEIVIGQHPRHPVADDRRGEELGEGGGDRLQQGALGHESDIGIHGEAGAGEETLARGDIVAVEAQGIGQDEPTLDAAFPGLVAVMIDDALAPDAPQLRIVHPGHERGILHRDTALVIEAVQRPGLDLGALELAAVEKAMEGMAVVISRRTHRAQPRLQLLRRQQLAHSSISMPSWATSQPALSSAWRSGESASSAVLLLFTWMKMRRPRGVAASNSMLPSGPDMLRWPMRCPVLLPRPAVIISSSRHSVPSKKSR